MLDSFCIGKTDDVELRAVSFPTGGYNFSPQKLEQILSICEMEPVLSQLERKMDPFEYGPSSVSFETAKVLAKPDLATVDVIPQRKEHPNMKDVFVQITSTISKLPRGASALSNREGKV